VTAITLDDYELIDIAECIVPTETIHTLIVQLSFDQACNDLQWLL